MYESVFEQAPDGIIVHDSDGQILDVNETVLEKLGYTREELHSMEITEIEVGLDEELLREKWQSMETGSIQRLELEGIHSRKDGSTFPVEVWVSRLETKNTNTDRFVAFARDITQRKDRERELERQEKKYRNLFEESRDALMLLDQEGYLDCNEATLELFGFDSVAEFTNYTPWKLSPSTQPDGTNSEAAAIERVEHALEEGGDFFEWTHTTGDGKPFSAEVKLSRFEIDDGPVLLALVRDISDRKERERELERYEHLWQNLPVGVCRIDPGEDAKFIEVNETLVDILGAESREELLQQPVAELWKEEGQREAFLEEVDEMDRETIERRFETLDGRTVWLRIVVMPQEEGTYIDVVAQDVTDRRQREIHLEKAQEVGNIGWWQTDIPSNEIYWSEQLYEMWGAEGEVGLIDHETFLEFIHPEDREEVDQAWEAAKEGEDYDIEHRIITDDGQTRWMREKAELTFDDEGDPVHAVGVVQDITERKTRELELERHRTYVENVTDVITLIDPDGTIEYVSPAVERVFGWDRTELIGENGFEYVHPDDRVPRISDVEELTESSGAKTTFEFRFQGSDGGYVWVEATAHNLLEEPDIEGILLSSRDIDERKIHEERLSTLHETTRRVVDAETKTEIAEIAVEAASDLLEFSLPSVWYPTDDDSELALVANSAEHQELLEKADTPDPTHPRDGWYWDVFEDNETVIKSPLPREQLAADVPLQSAIILPMGPHGVLACAAKGDVEFTDRQIRAAETLAQNVRVALDQIDQRAALERQKVFTDDLLDAIEDVIYVLDTDGNLIDWNAAFEDVTGYTSEDLESMNALNFFKETDTEAAVAAIEESFATGRTRVELDILTAEDESIPYEFIANTFENPDGELVTAGIGRDRSRHVEYEQTLEEQRDNLEILNQVVRHDIRNDMTVVRGRANLLAEHVEEAGKEDLEAVQDATESAIELTKTARDLAEIMLSTEEDVEPVRLDHHLETPVETARSEFDDAIIITDDRLPAVRVRGNDLLEAVFRNLIKNAIIHNDKGDPEVRISVTLDENTATVAVADNGPGIPDDQKETIFGKGEKGLDSPGTGLGLYLVQTLVEQYGGDVWVEDNDPEGSIFYVELLQIDEEGSR